MARIHRRSTLAPSEKPDLPRPTILDRYGGFDISLMPACRPHPGPFGIGRPLRLANLRGGGEFGEAWHRAGMLDQKQHVFDDFLAAARWLIDAGLTTPGRLGITGGSNGGLLVGAAMTQRPDLFGAVVCQVALLDMIRYERFKVARLWAAEYGSAEPKASSGSTPTVPTTTCGTVLATRRSCSPSS